MDSRIDSIFKQLVSYSQLYSLDVGSVDSPLCSFKINSDVVDTVFCLHRQYGPIVKFYTDSAQCYRLRFIGIISAQRNEGEGIEDEEYFGFHFLKKEIFENDESRGLGFPVITYETILVFDLFDSGPSKYNNELNGAGKLFIDDAMLRSSKCLLMYLAKLHPEEYYSFRYKDLEFQKTIVLNSNGGHYWQGEATITGPASYELSFSCNPISGIERPSEEMITEIVEECFYGFARINKVESYGAPVLGFSLFIKASIM